MDGEQYKLKAFGIFEGGGAKGLAHVGALKAAEEHGVKFVGVAGASAGAIIASLVAAGYTADELYNIDKQVAPRGAFDLDFLDKLGRDTWTQFDTLKRRGMRLARRSNVFWLWAVAGPWFYLRNRRVLKKVAAARGMFNTDELVTWLNKLLAERVHPSGAFGTVMFGDLPIPLKVVGTDLTNQKIKTFSKPGGGLVDQAQTGKEDKSVAYAVAASISIPLFFRPLEFDGMELVDGGLLSNFPAWLFDDERQREGPFTPTFGFKLVSRNIPDGPPRTRWGRLKRWVQGRWTRGAGSDRPQEEAQMTGFLRRLVRVTLAGDEVLETRQIESLFIVPLTVSVGTLDFELTRQKKDDLYREGRDSARTFFISELGPRAPYPIVTGLAGAHSAMRIRLGGAEIPLRVNIAVETSRKRLRITYAYNMEKDADDRLEFDEGGGACGVCWTDHDFVVCDLEKAKQEFDTKYRMNKYQQAMVRPSLKSLLCVPIFDPKKYDPTRQPKENPLIGVLNFDSDADLLAAFARPDVRQEAKLWSRRLANLLRPM
ncbi:MAG: patatin-like phospholipase family protein [Candidatus Binatia bacterium]